MATELRRIERVGLLARLSGGCCEPNDRFRGGLGSGEITGDCRSAPIVSAESTQRPAGFASFHAFGLEGSRGRGTAAAPLGL